MENKNIEAMHRKFYEWEKKPNFLEELREYFETTSREQILKEWEATKEFDTNGVVADKFLDILEENDSIIDEEALKNWGGIKELNENTNIKLVDKLLEFQEGLKSYNIEYNIFGDNITDIDRDYVIQHIVISRLGHSKYLNWRLEHRNGIFLPEWFNMSLKEVMIKDLYARKLSVELEIELLQDKIQKIDREIKRYENNSN